MKYLTRMLLFLHSTTLAQTVHPVCHICGEEGVVFDPKEEFYELGQVTRTCGEVSALGLDGFLTPSQCDFYQNEVEDICCAAADFFGGSPPPALLPAPEMPGPTPINNKPKFSSPSTGADDGLSQGGKAGVALFSIFSSLFLITFLAVLYVKGKRRTPRTADTAGAALDPDGSSTMMKDSDEHGRKFETNDEVCEKDSPAPAPDPFDEFETGTNRIII